jgi:hypothetical protein
LTVTAAQLDRARSVPTFDPIFWTARGGTLIAADWAEGFLQAIMLRMDAWDRLLKSKPLRRIAAWPAAGGRGPHHGGSGRVRPGLRHRNRRLLAQKGTKANLDAAYAWPIVRSAPSLKQVQPSSLIARANIVIFTRPTILKNFHQSASMVVRIKPIPNIPSLPIDSNHPSFERIQDCKRD